MPARLPPMTALRAFEAAARHLSFKRAAEELHVTPAAISQQVKLLEAQLGRPLFQRLTRALALTDAGVAMLPKLREGLANLSAALAATQPGGGRPVVRLHAPPSFAARWLVPRLTGFAEAQPETELRLASDLATIDRSDQRGGFAPPAAGDDDALSAIVRLGHGRYPGYVVDRLFAPDYTVVCSPALARRGPALQLPDDVRYFPLIHDETIPDLDERPSWSAWLARAGVGGVDVSRGPRFNSLALALEAAIAGQGLVLMPQGLISADIAAGRLMRPFDVVIPSRYAYYLLLPEASAPAPALSGLRDWLLAEVGAAQAPQVAS